MPQIVKKLNKSQLCCHVKLYSQVHPILKYLKTHKYRGNSIKKFIQLIKPQSCMELKSKVKSQKSKTRNVVSYNSNETTNGSKK